jgi:ketosteroid isomerase-like protein
MTFKNPNKYNNEFDSIKEVLERFRIGWEKSNANQILSTISQEDDVVIYGTDHVEKWLGYDEFVKPVESQVKVLLDPVYTWEKNTPRINFRGDVGWASGDLNVDFEIEGVNQKINMRSTFVLRKENQQWKIVQAHFSIGQVDAVVDY